MEDQNNITLDSYIRDIQTKWTDSISVLNGKMKDFALLPELMNEIYAKRQDAVDYYHSIMSKVAVMSSNYKKLYADKYNYYKVQSQIRYSSESAITAQIESDYKDLKYQIDMLSNLAKYMQETIKTIDALIFAINNRIKLEELIRGIKG